MDTEDKEFEEEFLSQEDPSMLHFLLASGEEVPFRACIPPSMSLGRLLVTEFPPLSAPGYGPHLRSTFGDWGNGLQSPMSFAIQTGSENLL